MKYLRLVITLSLLPLVYLIFDSRIPHTHDGVVHLARMTAYYKALSDGQFPVRWAGDLNYGYGMPLFNFMYQVPYLISSVFIFLGFGLANSFKLVLAISYVLSGIFMFWFGKAFFKDEKKALLITIFYQFAPFRFIELLVRGSFGEVYTYTFFPLILFGLTKLFKRQNYRNILITAIATSLLILSHNALSLSFFAIAVLFSLFFAGSKKLFLWSLVSLLLGIALAAFYWLPAIAEHKYTYGDLFMKDMYKEHFPPIQNFFIPNFNNSSKLQTGGISVQFGLFHELGLVSGIIFLYRILSLSFRTRKSSEKSRSSQQISMRSLLRRDDIKVALFCFVIFFTILFFMQPVSKIVWQHLSLLRQFQFPWRLLGLVAFATSLLSIFYLQFSFFKKQFIFWGLSTFVVISTAYYWKPSLGLDTVNEKYYWNYPLNTTYFGETDVIWSAGPAKNYPKQPVEIIGGTAKVSDYQKRSNSHTFHLNVQKDAQLADHTQYFPGWKVLVDKKPVDIQFQDPNWRGELTYRIPKGDHRVSVVFGESPIRFVADVISVITALGLIGLLFIQRFHPHLSASWRTLSSRERK